MKDNVIQGCLYSCIFNGFGGHHWILSAKLANAVGQSWCLALECVKRYEILGKKASCYKSLCSGKGCRQCYLS